MTAWPCQTCVVSAYADAAANRTNRPLSPCHASTRNADRAQRWDLHIDIKLEFKMIAVRDFGFIDKVNLNLDMGYGVRAARVRYQHPAKNALGPEDLFVHVNMQALEGLGLESSQAVQLKFTVVPVVNPFKGESNWRVIVDPRATDREKSAIQHATRNVQRIFDLTDIYQNVRALIV